MPHVPANVLVIAHGHEHRITTFHQKEHTQLDACAELKIISHPLDAQASVQMWTAKGIG
jgi:hypothetical protein